MTRTTRFPISLNRFNVYHAYIDTSMCNLQPNNRCKYISIRTWWWWDFIWILYIKYYNYAISISNSSNFDCIIKIYMNRNCIISKMLYLEAMSSSMMWSIIFGSTNHKKCNHIFDLSANWIKTWIKLGSKVGSRYYQYYYWNIHIFTLIGTLNSNIPKYPNIIIAKKSNFW